MKPMSQVRLIAYTSLFFVLTVNYTFFTNLSGVYPLGGNLAFDISTAIVLLCVTILFFVLFSSKWMTKPILMVAIIISSFTSYFIDSYHVVIGSSMIRNILQTSMRESMDLFSFKQILYVVFLGLIPAFIVYKTPVSYGTFFDELFHKLKAILLTVLIIVISLFSFSKHYTSFFREHRPLRYTINPLYWIYSAGSYINKTYNNAPIIVRPMGTDAIIPDQNQSKKLVIMVVGEASRADHFSLNGYKKETNPKLKKLDIINFSNTYSCGTSTAVSVPCMFSFLNRSDYSYKKGRSQENVIDVLKHTKKIALLWRDNNSDSKGVALRIPYTDFKTKKHNSICIEGECRDIGMLVGLQDFIFKNSKQDIFIVLHQMGNHGPAYYKRYTKKYQKFTPACHTNQLEECTKEEISNAYDNAILYTDNFLAQTVNFLKQYDTQYQTAMLYMADHGESLGENGIYLHGLPYFMAPQAQKHIGAMLWLGEQTKKSIDSKYLEKISDKPLSQDNLVHSILGLFDVKTELYDPKMDIFNGQ